MKRLRSGVTRRNYVNNFTITAIVPKELIVKHEDDGTPYIYYEGIAYCVGGWKFFITIPHLDMTINAIEIIQTEEYNGIIINDTEVECRLSNVEGEKIYFRLISLDEDKKDEDFFKWDGEN